MTKPGSRKEMVMFLMVVSMFIQSSTAKVDYAVYEKKIDSLKAKNHVWKATKWLSSLSRGLAKSESSGKPVLLWTFIHNPLDERC